MSRGVDEVTQAVGEIAAAWRAERAERQARRHLDRADFDALRAAGLLAMPIPAEAGGMWGGADVSARPLCESYRCLAGGDPSVALVSSMHPSVIAFWLASPDPSQPEWERQRNAVFASALASEQWGTITSEPGSGGDIFRTRATAAPLDGESFLPGRAYAVTGDKHFGSGMGVTDRMMTTAVPDGEDAPAIFVLDVRGRAWDGTAGLVLIAEWDGMGMKATQSHAMRLEGIPSVRMAWGGKLEAITRAAGPLVATLFTAVVLGVLDEAVGLARDQMRNRAAGVASVRAGRVGSRRAGPLAGRAGVRGRAAGDRVRRRRRRVARRPARQGVRRRARRADPLASHASTRRRHVLAALSVRALVRGRARARIPASAVGPGVRPAVHDVACVAPWPAANRAMFSPIAASVASNSAEGLMMTNSVPAVALGVCPGDM